MTTPDANSYVTQAELRQDKVVLTVRVDDFKAGAAVELSGQATMTNGAFATFYDVQNVPAPDDQGHLSLTVAATPVDMARFEKGNAAGDDITVVTRVSMVWATVLGRHHENPDNPNPNSLAWRIVKEAQPLSAYGAPPQPEPAPGPGPGW